MIYVQSYRAHLRQLFYFLAKTAPDSLACRFLDTLSLEFDWGYLSRTLRLSRQ
jgi:hypothetical protein